jgi:hypothetical protein
MHNLQAAMRWSHANSPPIRVFLGLQTFRYSWSAPSIGKHMPVANTRHNEIAVFSAIQNQLANRAAQTFCK